MVLLLLVVALASRPGGQGGSEPSFLSAAGGHLVDAVLYLAVALFVLSAIAIVWALWPEKGARQPPPKRPIWPTLLTLSIIAAIAFVLASRAKPRGRSPGARLTGIPSMRGLNGLQQQGAGHGSSVGVDWWAFAAALAVLLIIAGVVVWRIRRRRTAPGRLLELVDRALEQAMEDVIEERDPRQAVIAAWVRLEGALGRAGTPRRQAEAPFEYVTRVLSRLEISPAGVRRLASLFEWARFSPHTVDDAMRQEAIAALGSVRAELRAMREGAETGAPVVAG